jgi:hypothetical protein
MNGDQITELGQVREQENMLSRAQAQAARVARRELDAPGAGWFLGQGGWRRPLIRHRGQPHPGSGARAHAPAPHGSS